jgi:hypothetical protein
LPARFAAVEGERRMFLSSSRLPSERLTHLSYSRQVRA